MPLRIAIFVTGAYVRMEYTEAVSGHVQIPLMAAGILSDAGHTVTLITTKGPGADCLPYGVSEKAEVCVVDHATRPWPHSGVYPAKAIGQVCELRALLRKRRFDVVHFFGGTMTGLLLCALKTMGVHSMGIYTPIQGPPRNQSGLRGKLMTRAFGKVHRIVATADYVARGWASVVAPQQVDTLYPGIVKPLCPAETGSGRDSVLFWRNAGYNNGVDLAIASVRRLAPRYSNVRFTFAVRPHDAYEADLLELERHFANVKVHIYPYVKGTSLATLLGNALFVIQPFRRLSINPQMSILETLYARVPVVATDIESNGEIVRDGFNGLLIPPNDEPALSAAIERLLCDRPLLSRLSQSARTFTQDKWNWVRFGERLREIYDGLQ
jgi:glycosyltransferase involved in cell wall biosynthesis